MRSVFAACVLPMMAWMICASRNSLLDPVRLVERRRDQIACLVLAEEERDRLDRRARDADFGTDVAGQRHFGQRDQQPAVGEIVARVDAAVFDQLAHECAVLLLRREIDRRRGALFAAFDLAQIDRLAEMPARFADQDAARRLRA